MNTISNKPRILVKSYNGVNSVSIEDKMLERREIALTGEIDADCADSVIKQLLYLQAEDPEAPVTIYLNSPGGSVVEGLAIYDCMQACTFMIKTVCIGTAASMAAVLFAAGDRREMLQHSAVLIHDPWTASISGSALEVRSRSENLMMTRQTVAEVLAKHTGRTVEEIYEKTCADTYFYGEEAIEFGLADAVITTLNNNKGAINYDNK